MSTFQKILVPVDFGTPADRAAEVALSLAKDENAEVTLVHVFQPGADYGHHASHHGSLEERKTEAKKSLDAALGALQAKYSRVSAVFASGAASEGILHAAEQHHCDLIVMGTHGRRGLSRAFQGSIAEEVVRSASIPVLTVGPRADATSASRPTA